jgi:cell fate regulator YaaT (PSP1 superfamily)
MTIPNVDEVQTVQNVIAGVRFFEVGKVYHFSCDHLPDLMIADQVVVDTARGRQLGQVMSLMPLGENENRRDYKPILRKATAADLMSQKLWKAREVEALIICREKAAEIGGLGGVKFVAAQYNFDGTLLTFLFSSEDKPNTSRLKSALQRSFKAKLELRQIGPRDVAKLLGGMGACGIQRCCSTFLTDFSPISIKMAKAQDISLNPSEITGMCGRLRCCLIYEYEQYVEARKLLPKRNKRVGTPHGEGKVIDVHPLRDAVTVLIEETQYLVQREEIIPLEEYEAFKAKAEAGCSKSNGESCSCGAHGEAAPVGESALEVEEEEDIPAEPAEGVSRTEDSAETTDEQRKRQRHGRARRGRGRRPGGNRRDKGNLDEHE